MSWRLALRRSAGFVIAMVAASALQAAEATPESFEIFQYVAAGKYPPEFAIELDNNRELLWACRSGATREQLSGAGIRFAESQIELLIAMRLLARDAEGLLITTFPILDPAQAAALRSETAALADGLMEVIADDVATLSRRLEAFGLEEHGYAILHGYILDGMAWSFFEEYRRLEPRVLSPRRPFWSGHLWAMPPRSGFAPEASRAISKSGMSLRISSSAASSALVDQVTGDRAGLQRALGQTAEFGKVKDRELRDELGRFGLVDDTGVWSIPVIDETDRGAIFRSAEAVTTALVDAVLDSERVDLAGLRSRHDLRGDQQTLVMVYQELIWELMERLETAGLVSRPSILESPRGSAREIATLAFLVDRRRPQPKRDDVPQSDEPDGRMNLP
ncbi:MAG: hypothetical protein ACE5GX_14750 [Thermoanaerobaculia bacterium]